MCGDEGLIRIQLVIVYLGFELENLLIDQPSKLIILKPIHQHLLIAIMPLIIEQADPPQRIENLRFLKIPRQINLMFSKSIQDHLIHIIRIIDNARLQRSFNDQSDEIFIADQDFVIVADNVHEVGGADFLAQVGKD